MLYEFAGGFFLAICVLWFMGEYTKKLVFCIIAAAMLFPLGAWLLGEDIQIRNGENITISGTTTNESVAQNSTMTYTYTATPDTPYLPFENTAGLLCLLLGTFGLFHYGLSFLENKAE
jgi:hypothetical protein